jgi:hypothetical protein
MCVASTGEHPCREQWLAAGLARADVEAGKELRRCTQRLLITIVHVRSQHATVKL